MKQSVSSSRVTRLGFYSLILLWVLALPSVVLAADSGDYASRFTRAQALAKQGDDVAASKIYEDLIKLNPRLPQAYNNLAAIKARHGEYKQAQALLEQALRSDPVYATVYENLSAIYVEMARDSYGKALRLETPQQSIALRDLDQPEQVKPAQTQVAIAATEKPRTRIASQDADAGTNPARSAATKPVETAQPTLPPVTMAASETAEQPAAAAAEEKFPDIPETETKTDQAQAVAKPAEQMAAVETAPVDASKTTNTQKDTPPAGQAMDSKAPLVFNKEDVITSLQGWAAAWSEKAVDLYLVFYADNYAPAGETHRQWEAQRRQRLQAPAWIQVTLSDFQVEAIKDDEARVRLIQEYKASNYQDRTRKEFRLQRTPDGWRIIKEITLAKLN